MSETQPELKSFLVADCGTMTTKVVLLDAVEGEYRFVAYAEAPSTVIDVWDDVSVGVVQAIRRLEEIAGHEFLDKQGKLITPVSDDGKGADHFMAVSSAAEPLRAVLVGLTRDISLSSARRVALSTYCEIVDEIALEQDGKRAAPRTENDQINAIWHAAPDVILLVGGTNDGASEPVLDMVRNVVRVALYLMGDNVPIVVYAGNDRLRDVMTELVGEVARLQIAGNVRPWADIEHLTPAAEELELLFYDHKLKYLPGSDVLTGWGASILLPTVRAADYTIRYCDRAYHPSKAALYVDVGSTNVTLNVCQGGRPLTIVRSDLGVGLALRRLLEQVEMRDILRWIPFELDESEARNRLMNKALKPGTIPQTREDLLLEQAVAREAIRLALRDALPGWPGAKPYGEMIPPCDPIIASGGILAHAPYHGHAALLLLDALQPVGISQMYLDEYDLVAMLGATVNAQPLAMVQTLYNKGLTFLGTAVAPIGQARAGEKVLTIRPVDQSSSTSFEVVYGNLEAIPFQFFEPGTMLELIPAKGFDIGGGSGKSITIEYKGGTVGLIVDARGRPLTFKRDEEVQRQRMDDWLWEMMSA